MAAHQELSPLLSEEIERLRGKYDRLPVHDPRRRSLATPDQAGELDAATVAREPEHYVTANDARRE